MNEPTDCPQIQCMASEQIGLGSVAIIIHNSPMIEIDGTIKPGMKMSAREAMELGMSLIYVAQSAERMAPQ